MLLLLLLLLLKLMLLLVVVEVEMLMNMLVSCLGSCTLKYQIKCVKLRMRSERIL